MKNGDRVRLIATKDQCNIIGIDIDYIGTKTGVVHIYDNDYEWCDIKFDKQDYIFSIYKDYLVPEFSVNEQLLLFKLT